MNIETHSSACPFCHPAPSDILAASKLAVAIRDSHPAAAGHVLLLPRRHVVSFRHLSPAEAASITRLACRVAKLLQAVDPAITGFTYGTNDGPDAGQTISHCHFHLIPRRPGDTPNPRGGIRKAISARRPDPPPPSPTASAAPANA